MVNKDYILSTLKSHKKGFSKYGVSKIGLFGSYLYNKQSDKSDIDLLIEFEDQKDSFDNFMNIYDMVENLFQNKQIEIVTRNRLSKYIGPKILREVVYA